MGRGRLHAGGDPGGEDEAGDGGGGGGRGLPRQPGRRRERPERLHGPLERPEPVAGGRGDAGRAAGDRGGRGVDRRLRDEGGRRGVRRGAGVPVQIAAVPGAADEAGLALAGAARAVPGAFLAVPQPADRGAGGGLRGASGTARWHWRRGRRRVAAGGGARPPHGAGALPEPDRGGATGGEAIAEPPHSARHTVGGWCRHARTREVDRPRSPSARTCSGEPRPAPSTGPPPPGRRPATAGRGRHSAPCRLGTTGNPTRPRAPLLSCPPLPFTR